MQETWTLRFKNENKENSLDSLVKETLRQNQKELGIFLSYYTRKEGAVAEEVSLLGPVNFQEIHKGDFMLAFTKEFFNACLNIQEKERSQMKIGFSLDLTNSQINLIGPNIPEREPDEL